MTCYNSYVEVDCAILCNNIQSIQADLDPGTELIPVLKCDAYGLGADEIAAQILKAGEIRTFALAHVGEAAALRKAGFSQELLVLAGVPAAHIPCALQNNVQLTLYSPQTVRDVAEAARRLGKSRAEVQIKIETGLNRIGVKPGEELGQLLAAVRDEGNIAIQGVFTHFIDGEIPQSPLAQKQYELYKQALVQIETAGFSVPMRHICNSGGSDWYREAFENGARIGRRLYMDNQKYPKPAGAPGAVGEVASWRTSIVNVRTVVLGETVGYDERFRAERPTRVATICVGYGDGLYGPFAEAGVPVLVTKSGIEAKYLGICMDQSLIDVTGIDCREGDEVTIFGRSTGGAFLSAQRIGAMVGHEGVFFTSALTSRVERVYINRR